MLIFTCGYNGVFCWWWHFLCFRKQVSKEMHCCITVPDHWNNVSECLAFWTKRHHMMWWVEKKSQCPSVVFFLYFLALLHVLYHVCQCLLHWRLGGVSNNQHTVNTADSRLWRDLGTCSFAMTITKCYVFHLFPFRHWAAGLQLCGGCHQTVHVLPCVYVCASERASERSLGALSLSPGSLIRCVKAPLNDGLLCQCALRRINLFHWFLFRQNASVCCFPPPSRRLPAIIDGNGLRQINPFLVKIAANNPWLCLTSVNQREARFWQPHSQRALTPGESSRSTWTQP